jgi:DNA-binding HxlR family transcriptional regulator
VLQTARAAELLLRRWTTRIVTELDDNGPIPFRHTNSALADIPSNSRTPALRALQRRGLVAVTDAGDAASYVLSDAGQGLGDVYEVIARWARTHHYPDAGADFARRINHTLALLTDPDAVATLAGQTPPGPEPTEQMTRLVTSGLAVPGAGGRAPYTLTAAGTALRGPLAALQSWASAHAELLQPTPKAKARRAAVTATGPLASTLRGAGQARPTASAGPAAGHRP